MTRARNLANLGNKNAITADIGLFNIGIGSTQPHDYKLEVVGGDAYIGGGVTITGNLSVGGTVTYEDVTNVDAVGIITANKGVNIVGGGLTCVGVATFFSAIDANGDLDVDGTTNLDVLDVDGATNFGADVVFAGDAANITFDKSTDDLIFNDNAKAIFGTSSDGLEIYHDSSHSYIADTGTGRLHINSSQLRVNNAADNEILIDATQDTGVSLYDGANTVRLATNGNGVIVTGILTATSDIKTTANLYGAQGHFTDHIYIADTIVHTGDTNTKIRFPAADTITAETNSTERLRITSAGFVGIGSAVPNDPGGSGHCVDIMLSLIHI